MAADCKYCGKHARHEPSCPVFRHITMANTVTATVKAYLTKPTVSQYATEAEAKAAFNYWRQMVRELALMLAESHPAYTRVGDKREWSDQLEVAFRETMGLEGEDDAGAGENPD